MDSIEKGVDTEKEVIHWIVTHNAMAGSDVTCDHSNPEYTTMEQLYSFLSAPSFYMVPNHSFIFQQSKPSLLGFCSHSPSFDVI